jgi:twinkle protein
MTPPIDLILERLTNVRRHGNSWMASCPTREDYNPSLSVSEGEDGRVLLKDFGGDTTEEIVAAMGLTMADLFPRDEGERNRWMDEQRGARPARRAAKEKVYKTPEIPEDATFHEGAIRWFAKRGLNEETMRKFGVYAESHYFRKASGETNAICIPYRKNSKTVNIKYRSASIKDFAMAEGAEPIWFNLDAIGLDERTVICAEGELDVMALDQAGFANAISPPNGCESVSNEVFLSGSRFLGDERVRILLAGDMDEAGQKMMDEIARRVGKERCARVTWPTDCKDANDVLRIHGPEKVAECVHGASPFPIDGIVRVEDVMDGIWSLYADGLPRGESTGIPTLDTIYTVKTGYWTTVIASPGAGKSNLLDQIVVNLAENNDWRFAIASLENPDVPRHVANILPKRLRKPFREGPTDRMGAEEVEREAAGWMNDHFFFIQPEEPSLEEILRRAKALVFSEGIKGLILDPWNEMEHPPQGLNNGDYVSRCLTMIRRFAFRYDIHIWLVVHPTKLLKDANGQYPMPSLYDASGSALFNSKTDYGLCQWRDRLDFRAPIQIKCDKSRHAEVATLGTVEIGYDPATTRYYDLKATGENDRDQWRPKTFTERMEEQEPNEFGIAGEVADDVFTEAVMANA